ncbi:hypothetical protein HNQ59_002439 [Chitinivorax tropicus]|uniref:Uncharacterized protein n=1 Tax=Chitinivorax tropicus TaxID=714531 RepID=A0A840MVE0_9PROT|nr:hypothetical protein [Chitinivorax tropicus]MBB5019141.1 hypothetical protein [Chitinivorax tropicus]
MTTTPHHPWAITAPWYRWPLAGVPRSGRGMAPVLQKFASDDFVNEFIKDLQHSVRFNQDDQVFAINLAAASPGQFVGKLAALFPMKSDGKPWQPGDAVTDLRRSQLVGTGIRKLFLPSHGRHYLVVCELHCDVPGFPAVPVSEVCQAGFVVRRKRLDYPAESRPQAVALLRELVTAQAKLGEWEQTIPVRPAAARRRAEKIAKLKQAGQFDALLQAAREAVQQKRQALDAWRQANGVRVFEEGWVSGGHTGIGQWQEVETMPETLQETWLPLYRVFPDPANPAHDARGRALFFGVVPTSAFDTTAQGEARFDDRSSYEIRTFFRRHACCCPQQGLNVQAPDCDGELVWSAPTETYRLASQFDLQGTANRPVTVQMPNLAELAAQVLARPVGKFSPVKFVQPQTLQPKISGNALSGGSMGGDAFCFFAIPLITLVALFVLNLFLPIVVFIFNLWFLLALKFCILPSFKLDPILQAELAAIPGGADVDAAGFQFAFQGGIKTGVALRGDLTESLSHMMAEVAGEPLLLPGGIVNPKHAPRALAIKPSLDQYSARPLTDLAQVMTEQAARTAGDGSQLDLLAGLDYEPRRMCQWRDEPHLPTTGEYA